MDDHHKASIDNYFSIRGAFQALAADDNASVADFTRVGNMILKHSPEMYVVELRGEMMKIATGLTSIADVRGVKYDGRSVHVRTMDDGTLYTSLADLNLAEARLDDGQLKHLTNITKKDK